MKFKNNLTQRIVELFDMNGLAVTGLLKVVNDNDVAKFEDVY